MQDFKKYKIWENGKQIALSTYRISKSLPSEEKFGIKSQISRAAVSIPSNIAEGSSRSSNKEFIRFLQIALGSAFELETQLILIQDLYNSIAIEREVEDLKTLVVQEQKMINGFINELKRQSKLVSRS